MNNMFNEIEVAKYLYDYTKFYSDILVDFLAKDYEDKKLYEELDTIYKRNYKIIASCNEIQKAAESYIIGKCELMIKIRDEIKSTVKDLTDMMKPMNTKDFMNALFNSMGEYR